jgi:hypothetical protein
MAHPILHQADLALGVGAHALGDDLAGAGEGFHVAPLGGKQRFGIERARGLGGAFGHDVLP